MKALRELLATGSGNVPLDLAALEIAQIEHPGLDPTPWLLELDRIAFGVAERATDLNDGFRFIQTVNHYLFDEMGFHGNDTDYYDPRNSCLNDVLAFRTGLPITLSLVYMEVGRRLAKPVFGIGAPGHFLVQYDDARLSVFIDPFRRGRILTREQCIAALREYTGADVDDSMLPRVNARQVVLRMLRNLEGAYVRLNRFEDAVVVGDLLRLGGQQSSTGIPRWPSTGN